MIFVHMVCFVTEISSSNKFQYATINSTVDIVINDLMIDDYSYILLDAGKEVKCGYNPCQRYSSKHVRRIFKDTASYYELSYVEKSKNRIDESHDKEVIIINIQIKSQKELDLISFIRDVSSKSYMVLFVHSEEDFKKLADYIITKELFNIYILKEVKHDTYLMYEICAYCRKGNHSVNLINSWKFGKGFGELVEYKSSFKRQFYGADLKIGALIIPPAIFPMGVSPNGKVLYTGPEWLTIETLGKSLNFNPVLVQPKDGMACEIVDFGTPAGFCKQLLDKEVALAGFPYPSTELSNQILQPTQIYHQLKHRIVSARQEIKNQGMSPSDALSFTVVLPILSSVVLVAACLWLIQIFMKEEEVSTFSELLLQVISALFLEPINFKNFNNPKLIAYGVWMVASFFVISSVFGEITSMTATPVTSGITINTIEDMKTHDYSWVRFNLYDDLEIFEEALPDKVKNVKELGLLEALQFVLKNPTKYVFPMAREAVDPLIRMYLWDGKGENPFHFSPPVLGKIPSFMNVLQRKDSPFRNEIERVVGQMNAAGLYTYKFIPDTLDILSQFFKSPNVPIQIDQDADNVVRLTIEHLRPSLILISFIWCGAFVAFLIEIFLPQIYQFIAPVKNVPKEPRNLSFFKMLFLKK